jgi:hypothetical protein
MVDRRERLLPLSRRERVARQRRVRGGACREVSRSGFCRSELARNGCVGFRSGCCSTARARAFVPPFGRPESLSLVSPRESNQREGDPTVAPTSLRDAGALRYSPLIGRRELGHPWPRTSAPFPDQRLRCSARHTGSSRHAAFAFVVFCPAPGRLSSATLGLRALRGHDGRVTGPLAGRRAGAAPGPQGRAHGGARVRAAQDALSANPRRPIAYPEAGCRRATGWGALSLGYFSLGKQREVTRAARRAARKLLIRLSSNNESTNNQNKTTHTGRGHGPLPHQRLAHQRHRMIKRRGREQARSYKGIQATGHQRPPSSERSRR